MALLTKWRRLPQLIRFMTAHGALGFGIATLFMAGLLAADPGDARYLLLASAGHWWPAGVLWFFLGLTFGSVQMGVALMLLADAPAQNGGGHRAPLQRLVPIRVVANRPRRR